MGKDFFLCCKIFAPKNVFSFLPFYLFVLSHFGLIAYGCDEAEPFLPFSNWGRYAPVTAALANPTHHREDQNETNFSPRPFRCGEKVIS